MIAYLVVREGNKWRDVYRLTPGQMMTIGRAPSNRIVLHDDVCSRNHCEVFQQGNEWRLRDLGSRNGTLLDNVPVVGEVPLRPGQLIQIGPCDLAYTNDLAHAFPDTPENQEVPESTGTVQFDNVLDAPPPAHEPTIIHRRGFTRYSGKSEPPGRDRTSRELAQLYRLALDMGAAGTSQQLAEVVLGGVTAGTCADIGALLLLTSPAGPEEVAVPGQLSVIAYKGKQDLPYQKVSDHLSGIVLSSREAVLARDVADDSRLIGRDSLGEIHAKSVICAPIRMGKTIYGLIHLYSTDPEKKLEPDDLEFTLAIGDQCAVALDNMRRQESMAVGLVRVRDENFKLREQLGVESELVGDSPQMQELKNKIARIAPTDAAVLIRGESGVGKELVARAVHFSSRRRSNPFVCMNCAALTESLLESELFGHEKGSFTGATGRKAGKFEQAHKGTIMLDEVGEMSLAIQAKFLRVLEGHPFERVGGGSPVQVDVRVVAATNRDLERAVDQGTFRKDLYFRLHVVQLNVPELREHMQDVPVLALHFLERYARKANRQLAGFTPRAMEKLTDYDWPGNIRELQNTVERAVVLCATDYVGPNDIQLSELGLADELRSNHRPPRELPGSSIVAGVQFAAMSLEAVEQQHILNVLEQTHWNKSQSAQILGIERSTLDRKLKRYQVARPER